ncbi:MAG: methionyl-tRNA formyltransferase [Dehalococcoidales bacterium]|nr:methionyl-tRNA formyltransferase [Dehalococcoidales bacterium]
MRIVFMGTPQFAVPALEQLVLDGCDVAAVYTQPDKEAGRGRMPLAPPVKRAALALGLRVEQPVSLKQADAVQQLADFRPDVIVVAAYGKILPSGVLSLPPHGVLNIHPSLLPRFRGASPVASAILAGNQFTGVSVMLLDEGMDTGPVLARAQVSISLLDTAGSMTDKLARVGANLLLDVIPRWLKGELVAQAQDESQATLTRKFEKEDGEIDWSLPAKEISLRVRAFTPWPGTYTRWQGKQVKITRAVPLPAATAVKPGQVVSLGEGKLGIGTGDGILGVLQVQLEGKREMTAAAFLNGQRDFLGAVLPS